MSDEQTTRRLTTILAADIVGYSKLMGVDEVKTLGAVKADREHLFEILGGQYGGRIIKVMGDGVLMEFRSVVDAVSYSLQFQEAVGKRNAHVADDLQIAYRIGINIGDVIVDGEDMYGEGVNVAARLEPLAEPGGICISRSVRDQIRDKLECPLEDLGDVEVKNIARPVRVFRVLPGRPNGRSNSTAAAPVAARRWPIAAILIVAVVGGVSLWLAGVFESGEPPFSNPELPNRPSIAVLPFENRSDATQQEYFADGLTDDLITDLSKISGLFVIARNSVFTFKGQNVRTEEVARDLGVRYVLEGSVRRAGTRVRVNAQLVEGSTGQQIWAERYDRDLTDLFDVQDELVSRIVSALAVRLTSEETEMAHRRAPKFEAYDIYLRARDGFFSRDQNRMRESLALFAQAWTIDSTFARAYAGYAQLAADIWRLSSLRYSIGGATARKSAEVAARKALKIDPTLADAHSVLAIMKMVDKEHGEAKTLASRAVQLEPNNADAHTANAIVLAYSGNAEASLKAMRTAMRLNPKPLPYHLTNYGLILFLNRRFAETIDVLSDVPTEGIRSLGDAPGEVLAMAFAASDRVNDARLQVDALRKDEPFLNLAYYRLAYDHHARSEDLQFRLEMLKKAGMPDWPYGFRGDGQRRLPSKELTALIDGKTWSGTDISRESSFIQEFGKDESAVHATSDTLLNGVAFVEGGILCERFEGFVLGRNLCGPVFENPGGTKEARNQFSYVNPATILHFSLSD